MAPYSNGLWKPELARLKVSTALFLDQGLYPSRSTVKSPKTSHAHAGLGVPPNLGP